MLISWPEPAFYLWCPHMELRQLRYFVAVAETGNISQAAKRIFLTQPALSRQIRALEEEIGQCLLKRSAHSIELTSAGEVLLREARDLLQRADQAVERVRDAGKETRLRIGYAPSLASGILSVATERFTQTHSGAKLEFFDLSTVEMLSGLQDETLDLVLTIGPGREANGFKWTPLVRIPWQVAMSRKHALATESKLTPEQLAKESLLVFCQRGYPEYRDALNAWFKSHRLNPRIAGEYDGAETLMSGVESGLGVALVGVRIARLFPERATFREITDPPEPLCIAAGFRAKQAGDKVLAVFVEELKVAAKEVPPESIGRRKRASARPT